MLHQLYQALDSLWKELVEQYPEAIAWLFLKPESLDDFLGLGKVALYFAAVMAVIGFLQLGANPVKVMYDRSHAVADGKFFSPLWKLLLFVFGEDIFYRGLPLAAAVYFFDGDPVGVLATAVLISIACGFLPPHRYLPLQTQIAIMPGVLFLSLIYLKSGGWESAWPYVSADGLLVMTAIHAPPVLILTTAFEIARRKHRKKDDEKPRLP